jgi:hypothetical protein
MGPTRFATVIFGRRDSPSSLKIRPKSITTCGRPPSPVSAVAAAKLTKRNSKRFDRLIPCFNFSPDRFRSRICAKRPEAAVAPGTSHGAKPSLLGFPTPTSSCSVSQPWSKRVSATSRTAVYGPVRTVVWEGRSRKAPPYPDQGYFRGVNRLSSHVNSTLSVLQRYVLERFAVLQRVLALLTWLRCHWPYMH